MHFSPYLLTENVLPKRQKMAFLRPLNVKLCWGSMPLDPSCLERLLHSNFSFRAYTFKISRYCPYRLLMVAIKSVL